MSKIKFIGIIFLLFISGCRICYYQYKNVDIYNITNGDFEYVTAMINEDYSKQGSDEVTLTIGNIPSNHNKIYFRVLEVKLSFNEFGDGFDFIKNENNVFYFGGKLFNENWKSESEVYAYVSYQIEGEDIKNIEFVMSKQEDCNFHFIGH